MLHLRIITPKKVVLEEDVRSITAPSSEGEITVLPRHTDLFTLLQEGIVTIHKEKGEDYLSIGGGYLETDGTQVNVLVSRAYKQDEIDEVETKRALEQAQKILKETKNADERHEAASLLRRSTVDMKLLRHRRKSSV